MKIKKLLKIVLVAPSYIVVDNAGENMRIQMSSTDSFSVGEMYEHEETLTLVENIEKEKEEVSEEKEVTEKEEVKSEEEEVIPIEDEFEKE